MQQLFFYLRTKQINMELIRRINLMGFWWVFFSGHFSIGKFTFFGENAMMWSLTIHGTKWGNIHIDLPILSRLIGKRTWCIYASPNGTPWACTWYIGTTDKKEKIRAQIRKFHFGHNNKNCYGYSEDGNVLYRLNERMDTVLWKSDFIK